MGAVVEPTCILAPGSNAAVSTVIGESSCYCEWRMGQDYLNMRFSGTTSAYCGIGCQSVFGSCTGSSPSSTSQSGTPTPSPSFLQDCLASKNVPVSFTSSSNFAALAQPYNLRLAYTPAVIVLPTTVTHISDAVLCAADNKVKVQAKSGGHSYASYSSGGQNGSMIIDLESGFQGVTVDANGVARVEAGLRLGNMALAIFDQGGRALPHGKYPPKQHPWAIVPGVPR